MNAQECTETWQRRTKKCIRLEGDYFKMETMLSVVWNWNKLFVAPVWLLFRHSSYVLLLFCVDIICQALNGGIKHSIFLLYISTFLLPLGHRNTCYILYFLLAYYYYVTEYYLLSYYYKVTRIAAISFTVCLPITNRSQEYLLYVFTV